VGGASVKILGSFHDVVFAFCLVWPVFFLEFFFHPKIFSPLALSHIYSQ
jgi:hypothetical protein